MSKIGVVGIPGSWSSEKLVEALERETGFGLLIDMSKTSFDLLEEKVYYEGEDIALLDGLIIKKIGEEYSADLLDRLEALRFINTRGLKIFSKPDRILRLLDRLSCTVSLKLGNIPMPPTVITENINEGIAAVNRFGKTILKPLYSTKARGMELVEPGASLERKLRRFKESGNPVIYIQKMIDIPGKDLGVVFLGGEYLATYSRQKHKDSWNTTTHNGGKYQRYDPPRQIIDLAYKAQSIFDLDFTCVDVVETADGPLVFEVSAFGGFRGLWEANGIDAASLYAKYVLENTNNG